MAPTTEMIAEVDRARRMARQLDGASQDMLRRYLREVEYDLVYRSHDRDRRISI